MKEADDNSGPHKDMGSMLLKKGKTMTEQHEDARQVVEVMDIEFKKSTCI